MKDRTTHDKIDRADLAVSDISPATAKAPAAAPRTRMERLVAKCWEDELKITGIGIEDDFFSIGGDSRHALQMIFRIQELLPVVLPLGPLFFQDPTIKGFAAQLSELFQIDEEQHGEQVEASTGNAE
jgi:Phosphopantetheine attachment site